MSDKKDTESFIQEKKRKLEFMERVKPEIEEWASVNYHRKFLKQWLYCITCIAIGVSLAFVLLNVLPLHVEPLTALEIESAARTIFAPSITMNGLFITFVPVISFFYMAEIKEEQGRNEEAFRGDTKEFTKEEDLKVVRAVLSLVHAFWHNFRAGVLSYTRSYLIVSLLSLFALLILYIGLSPAQFVLADILLLMTILTGILPIINVALYKPVLELEERVSEPKLPSKSLI